MIASDPPPELASEGDALIGRRFALGPAHRLAVGRHRTRFKGRREGTT